jgi:serine protease inhibitor
MNVGANVLSFPNIRIKWDFFQDTFTGIDGKTKQRDFMNSHSEFLYAEDAQAQVLGLPYKNDELHMFLFLPTDTGKCRVPKRQSHSVFTRRGKALP